MKWQAVKKKCERNAFFRQLVWDIYCVEENGIQQVQCIHCQKPLWFLDFTLDHLKPTSKGGKTDIFNLLPACHPCNVTRGNTEDLSPKYAKFIMREVMRAHREKRITRFSP